MSDSVGQMLRHHREEKGLTMEEVSKITKVPEKTLQLIENDQFRELPAPAYTKGFIKLFAQAVGADLSAIVGLYMGTQPQAMKQELTIQNDSLKTEPLWVVILRQVSQILKSMKDNARKLNPRVWIVSAGILILLTIVSWVRSCGPSRREEAVRPDGIIQKKERVQIPEVSSNLIDVKEEPRPTRIEAEASQAVRENFGNVLKLTAKVRSTVWIRVYCDERLVFEGTLKKGIEETWQAQKYFKMRLGNPEAIDFMLNGRELGHIGPRGKISNIRLTEEGWYISD